MVRVYTTCLSFYSIIINLSFDQSKSSEIGQNSFVTLLCDPRRAGWLSSRAIPACNFVSSLAAICYLSDNIHDYHFVSQGKVTVASIDDAEEMQFTDVSDVEESRVCPGR